LGSKKLRVVVLISGNGSNLQILIDKISNGEIEAEIAGVISNKADAFGLQRAHSAGVSTSVLDNKQYPDRESYDAALQKCIDDYQAGLVVLAGFMRILTANFVNHYLGRMINIHPSLLPKYRGLNTHQRALEAKENYHGASVHFVTPELDGGPVILQSRVKVAETDTVETLANKVHVEEYKIYPLVVSWFAQNRLSLQGDTVILDQQELNKGLLLEQIENCD